MYCDDEDETLYVVATCDCGHGKACTRQRTLLERKEGARPKPAQGRPLGFLCAWRRRGKLACCSARNAPQKFQTLPRQERETAREAFKLVPGAQDLLDYERDRRPGEPEEPPGNP